MKDISFFIVGGDMRSYELAKSLIEEGHRVSLYGFDELDLDEKIKEVEEIDSAIKDLDVIVLPIPISRDGVHVNMPYTSKSLAIKDVFKMMEKEQVLIGGRTLAYEDMKKNTGLG